MPLMMVYCSGPVYDAQWLADAWYHANPETILLTSWMSMLAPKQEQQPACSVAGGRHLLHL
jgi:hypothetical protein